MTAKEFLEQQAKRFGLTVTKASDGDFDMRVDRTVPPCSAYDLIQLTAILHEAEYSCVFMKDNSIHVHAPHRKEHSWGDRGWECTHGLTVEGCERFRLIEKYSKMTVDALIETRIKTVKGRDECLGDLYRSVHQDTIDEIDTVLKMRTLTDTQKLRMGLRGREMAQWPNT